MLALPAFAQAAAPAAGGGDFMSTLIGILPLLLMFPILWFLVIRPQQKRAKAHQDMIKGLQKGDQVVTYGGLIGKVRAIQDDEIKVELAPNTEVRVVRSMIMEVRNKSAPAPANDSKPVRTGE